VSEDPLEFEYTIGSDTEINYLEGIDVNDCNFVASLLTPDDDCGDECGVTLIEQVETRLDEN
jgi:hypothetical protein